MKQLKQGNKARILSLKKQREIETDHEEVTAVTRSLFSETWHSYVDQASTAAIKYDQNPDVFPAVSASKKQTFLRVIK
ncbi:MAG: hypothetical protein JJ895_11185 [Balneolaceae bacterium]|nr:hypothetical protein [Balneolaceae bacterium]